VAKDYVEYLFTPDAQREFVACGFRSVNPTVRKECTSEGVYPAVKSLWSVNQKLGGWLSAQQKFFDSDRLLDKIMADVSKRNFAVQSN